MKNIFKSLLVVFLISSVFGQSNVPRSREAVLFESSSPTEVVIKATGYGIDKKHRKPKASVLDKSANLDAKRAAVWFLLYGGSDPLLQTDKEQKVFEEKQEDFFRADNIKRFITWEAKYYDTRIKKDRGKRLMIEKTFRVNKELVQNDLEQRGVLIEAASIASLVGLPSVMVIPEKRDEIAPLKLLEIDPNVKKGAEVIESYLSAKQYEAIVPEQQQMVADLASTQFTLDGAEEDYSYLMALSIGSDVYITYNISIETRMVGSTQVKKGIVACRAYETTTARLLGTETGYSHERPAAAAIVIEEAMNDAIDKVLSRIMGYWKKDIENGVQYKLILSVSTDFDNDSAEEIIFSFNDMIKEVSKSYKENVVADYTYDVQLWCDPAIYRSSTDLYRFFKKNYRGDGLLKKTSISRKLILLNVVEE